MTITKTPIKDLLVINTHIFRDSRGWFQESYNEKLFIENGINVKFIQDNHSFSKEKGILRGLHFQNQPYAQTKLVRCTRGKIWDVAVDLRKSSPTYLMWYGIELSEENHKQLLIPKGFAHGFVTLQKNCEVEYKVDNLYKKMADRSIRYNDLQISIEWPIKKVFLSEKDINAPLLKDSDVNFI